MSRQLLAEVVSEVHKSMHEYAKSHFGIPNGADFPDFAKTMSENNDICTSALLHFLFVAVSGKDMAEVAKNANQDDKNSFAKIASQCSAFQGYVEAIYLGYLLGKRIAEAEILERMQSQ